MGREIRRVHPDWVHPEGQALMDGHGYGAALREWLENAAEWDDDDAASSYSFEEYPEVRHGGRGSAVRC